MGTSIAPIKRIGFFGGTFDPIHHGHINLAIQLSEAHQLDKVLFCPASCTSLKAFSPPIASPTHRLTMTRLAIEEIPSFELCDLEIKRQGISFTLDTLSVLHQNYALEKEKIELFLLLSEEAFAGFSTWKEPKKVLQLCSLLIGARSSSPCMEAIPLYLKEALTKGFTPTSILDISSTVIRDRLKQGRYCGHLVPKPSLDYLTKHQLYGS